MSSIERSLGLGLAFTSALAVIAYKSGYKVLALTIAVPTLFWGAYYISILFPKKEEPFIPSRP